VSRWVRLYALLVSALLLAVNPAGTWAADAQSASVPVFSLDAGSSETQPMFWVRTGVPREWGAAEIAAEGKTGFEPFDAKQSHTMTMQDAVWVQWRVRATQTTDTVPAWTLVFSKPFVDRVSLHHRDEIGQWHSRAAGSEIAHAQWPLRRLQPQLTLPRLPAGEHTLYLKVQLDVPIRFDLALLPEPEAQQASQNGMLVAGLTLGLIALVAVLCAVMAVSYKDKLFTFYGLYVVMAWFLSASYMGVGNYALWPHWAHWGGISTLALSLLTMGAQLLFCSAVFLRSRQQRRFQLVVWAVTLYTLLVAALFLGPYHDALLVFFGSGLLLSVGLIMVIVMLAFSQGSRIARWWLLSYVPIYLLLGATIFEHLGIAALPWLPFNAPVYALVVEMLVLLAALHQYGKGRHAQSVRAQTLSRTEPGTGFLAPNMFESLTKRAWQRAVSESADMALAYVQVLPGKRSPATTTWNTELAMQRCARLLHQVLRSRDWVSRVRDDTVVIAMPGMSMGDALTERYSRLVALGLMSDPHDPINPELRFRIAVGTQGTYPGSLQQLRDSLEKELAQQEPETQPPITYLSLVDNLPSQSELEDIWDQALAATEQRTQPQQAMPCQGKGQGQGQVVPL
jgi:GGDEF domain-containing protein